MNENEPVEYARVGERRHRVPSGAIKGVPNVAICKTIWTPTKIEGQDDLSGVPVCLDCAEIYPDYLQQIAFKLLEEAGAVTRDVAEWKAKQR